MYYEICEAYSWYNLIMRKESTFEMNISQSLQLRRLILPKLKDSKTSDVGTITQVSKRWLQILTVKAVRFYAKILRR